MTATRRATGVAGFALAQPSHDRIYAAQLEYDIYKPMDLSQIDTSVMEPKLLDGVKANTTIDGKVYAVPHQWGTSGVMADKSKAPDVKGWADLCDPKYKGKRSEEHTSELQSLIRISYAVFCLKKKNLLPQFVTTNVTTQLTNSQLICT